MFETLVVDTQYNLTQLVRDINNAHWDKTNEMTLYDVPSLLAYLERQDTLLLACYETAENRRTLLGLASSRFEIKPYAGEKWLYIDEVDVCSDQRRKGAGKALMKTLLSLARDARCTEVWLGTELDNVAANALYKSLDPDEVEQFVGYAYAVDE